MNNELYHHGILGMKWGIRTKQSYGHGGYIPKNRNQKYEVRIVKEILSKIGKKSVGDLKDQISIGNEKIDKLSKTNLQLFAKKPRRKFSFKNKQEAAIVIKAFRNDVSKEDKKEPMLSKSINIDNQGAYVYTAENMDGKGDFRVCKKQRIKDSSTRLYDREDYNE